MKAQEKMDTVLSMATTPMLRELHELTYRRYMGAAQDDAVSIHIVLISVENEMDTRGVSFPEDYA